MKAYEVKLTNDELIKKCNDWVRKLIDTGGRAWTLKIPADIENDPDILFSELASRLQDKPTPVDAADLEGEGLGELTIEDYKEVINDYKRLVRELDIIINGKNAAKQASLCDIVAQLKNIFSEGDRSAEAIDIYETMMCDGSKGQILNYIENKLESYATAKVEAYKLTIKK